MQLFLYANGNAENHGCEALSRSISGLFPENQIVEYLKNADNSKFYQLPLNLSVYELFNNIDTAPLSIQFCYKLAYKLKLKKIYFYFLYRHFYKVLRRDDICLSIGGDNYCYSGLEWLNYLNHWISRKAKTILLGASINEEAFQDKSIAKDLRRYSKIVARESLTYDALAEHGLGDRTVLLPDPAFLLQPEATELPKTFVPGNTVGINISPMIMEYEKNQGAAYRNYEALIQHILDYTDMSVALIPHVVWQNNDDRIPLQHLYDSFGNNNRVCMVEDQNCMRLKYIISQCRFFVGARTHATIAAYSTCTPTLVVGYSIKARGIAKDLFGTYENYVLPVQDLQGQNNLTDAFCWLVKNEHPIREKLQQKMPEYIASAKILADEITKIR